MIPASLYTHVARPCEPCAKHHEPRLHRYPRTAFPVPYQESIPGKVHRRTQAKPMSTERRAEIYSRGRFTVRQWRQLNRMEFRERVRALREGGAP